MLWQKNRTVRCTVGDCDYSADIFVLAVRGDTDNGAGAGDRFSADHVRSDISDGDGRSDGGSDAVAEPYKPGGADGSDVCGTYRSDYSGARIRRACQFGFPAEGPAGKTDYARLERV